MSIKNQVIGLTETNIITATQETAILSILFCNVSGSATDLTLYAYPSAGSAGDNSTILKELSIPANDTFIWTGDEKLILDVGDKVSALADINANITATLNYKEI